MSVLQYGTVHVYWQQKGEQESISREDDNKKK